MTTRNLDALFDPQAIALIGASNQPGSLGQVLARNLMGAGFQGPVMCVNPHESAIRSAMAYHRIQDLPAVPDLAVIATPPATIPGLIGELAQRGCRAAVVITAGLDASTRQAMLDAARPTLLRIVGPNCLGFLSPGRGINASFAHLTPAEGGVALVAQSGAITTAALDWAQAAGVGLSHVITMGDVADVDFGDVLDYLALDSKTHAVLLYVESIGDARKFMTAGRICARTKPVMVIKAGRSAAGAKAAFSHTGALAGADAVYDAAFRRAGMVRVADLRELFDAVATLGSGLRVAGERLAILTNGGGAGVLAVDALAAIGGQLAPLSPDTVTAIDAVAPANWSRADPVDIIGDAGPERYRAATEALLSEPQADAILVMNCPTAVGDSSLAADAVIAARAAHPGGPPLLASWLGAQAVAEGRRRLAKAKIPTYETPDEAVRAFGHLVEHRRNQALLAAAPGASALSPERLSARQIVRNAMAEGRTVLDPVEVYDILSAYGVAMIESRKVATPDAAAEAATAMGGPVALKIASSDVTHKSDIGGVALGLSPREVAPAATAMAAAFADRAPGARLDGFIVQPMIARPKAVELLAGMARDPTFGPVVLFGQGGVAVEVLADRSIGLPPLDDGLARDLIRRTRVAALLAGYRDRPAADLAAISDVLVRLAALALEIPEIRELDLNPLLADADGVLALDARIRLDRADEVPARSAIRAYPLDLVHTVDLDGEPLQIRPARPSDAAALAAMIDASTPEDVRLRFGSGFRPLPDSWGARLSYIDYDREMALVAEARSGQILGVVRFASDPEGRTAEIALMVRSDRQHRGLGGRLLEDLLDCARDRGLVEVWGDVASDNAPMLDLARALGFSQVGGDDVARTRISRLLAPAAGSDRVGAS
jgi:acetyltransferase